jgi:ornithine cyclodeaminase
LIVEYAKQSLPEGEIQRLDASHIYAERWEFITENKPARENNTEITVFDSVGFALEDLSTLKMVYKFSRDLNIGKEVDLKPNLKNQKKSL